MNFYITRRIGTGTIDDPYRPDLPDGVSFVGSEREGTYLVATNIELPKRRKWEGPYECHHDRIKEVAVQHNCTIDELESWSVAKSEQDIELEATLSRRPSPVQKVLITLQVVIAVTLGLWLVPEVVTWVALLIATLYAVAATVSIYFIPRWRNDKD